jgi:N-methylhydantoinase A/oxoprolinase/acetone carboxylase beta subunit
MPSSESFEDVLVVNRNDLPLETAHSGPMIVEDVETTVVVAPGWEVVRKQCGAIILQFVNQGVAVRSEESAAIELNA